MFICSMQGHCRPKHVVQLIWQEKCTDVSVCLFWTGELTEGVFQLMVPAGVCEAFALEFASFERGCLFTVELSGCQGSVLGSGFWVCSLNSQIHPDHHDWSSGSNQGSSPCTEAELTTSPLHDIFHISSRVEAHEESVEEFNSNLCFPEAIMWCKMFLGSNKW